MNMSISEYATRYKAKKESQKLKLKASRAKKRISAKEAIYKSRVSSFCRGAIKINKEPCIVCGDVKSEGHHYDYEKPFDVIWYCHKHHMALHKNLRLKEKQSELDRTGLNKLSSKTENKADKAQTYPGEYNHSCKKRNAFKTQIRA